MTRSGIYYTKKESSKLWKDQDILAVKMFLVLDVREIVLFSSVMQSLNCEELKKFLINLKVNNLVSHL